MRAIRRSREVTSLMLEENMIMPSRRSKSTRSYTEFSAASNSALPDIIRDENTAASMLAAKSSF